VASRQRISHNLKNNRWKKNTIMHDVFRAKEKKRAHAANGSDEFTAARKGREARINYRDFGHWVDMADEARSAEEFEQSVLQEQVEQLKKYVVKRTAYFAQLGLPPMVARS
jgi:hypothetical protein